MSCRDLWYFLYSSTNREFRSNHLEEVLKYYHHEVSVFWRMENFEMSFEDFMSEMNEVKLSVIMMLAMPIIYVMMNPDKEVADSFATIRRLQKSFQTHISAEEKDDDEPGWKEIRSRFKEIILELFDDGFLAA